MGHPAVTLNQTLLRVANALNQNDVTYALAGGFALGVYCEPRATIDIDIVVVGDLHIVEEVLRGAFSTVYRNLNTMTFPLVRVHRFLLIEGEQEQVLDLLEPIETEFAAEVRSRARRIDFMGTAVPLLAPELLFILKRRSSRTQDQLDADSLWLELSASFDPAFLNRWLPEL